MVKENVSSSHTESLALIIIHIYMLFLRCCRIIITIKILDSRVNSVCD